MSTTPQSATASATASSTIPAIYDGDDRIPPSELFDEFVFYSSEWCSACFARIRDVDRMPVDHDHLGTNANAPTETRTRRGDGTLGYDFDEHDAYGHKRSYHPQTYCGACGANGGRAPELTLSKRAAVARCDQLVDCLLAQGVPVNRPALKHIVAEAKERDSLAGADHEIYARGVAFARRVFCRQRDE